MMNGRFDNFSRHKLRSLASQHTTKPLTKITATIIVILTDILFVFVLATVAEYISEYYKESLGNKYLKYKLSKTTLNEMDSNKDGQVSNK